MSEDNTLSEHERQQAQEEHRRANIWAQEQAAVAARQKEVDRANNVSRMSAQEFAAYKREQFKATEQRQREADKQAKTS